MNQQQHIHASSGSSYFLPKDSMEVGAWMQENKEIVFIISAACIAVAAYYFGFLGGLRIDPNAKFFTIHLKNGKYVKRLPTGGVETNFFGGMMMGGEGLHVNNISLHSGQSNQEFLDVVKGLDAVERIKYH